MYKALYLQHQEVTFLLKDYKGTIMKRFNQLAIALALISSGVIASDYSLPLENINVLDTESPSLSMHNLSNEIIELDVYGKQIILPPTSGVQFNCESNQTLELQVKGNDHSYFEVPCQSRVVFDALFTNQYSEG